MSNEEKSDKPSDMMNAAANLAKAIPVYDDAVQPLAKETGKALQTVGRCVNVALMPIRGAVWGFEQIEEWVGDKVSKKLENVSPEKIETPDLSIAGPTIEALKFNGHKEELSDMFASLLASSMNADTSEDAHPAFVALISAMTPLEAKLLHETSKFRSIPSAVLRRENNEGHGMDMCRHFCPQLYHICDILTPADAKKFHAAVDNLERMGLLESDYDRYLTRDDAYKDIEESKQVISSRNQIETDGSDLKLTITKGMISLTMFGQKFSEVCFR